MAFSLAAKDPRATSRQVESKLGTAIELRTRIDDAAAAAAPAARPRAREKAKKLGPAAGHAAPSWRMAGQRLALPRLIAM
jgi:hypothetical protein